MTLGNGCWLPKMDYAVRNSAVRIPNTQSHLAEDAALFRPTWYLPYKALLPRQAVYCLSGEFRPLRAWLGAEFLNAAVEDFGDV